MSATAEHIARGARTLAEAVPMISPATTSPNRATIDPAAIGNPFHVVAVHIEPDPWTMNPRGTAYEQTRPMADAECEHGHLPTDARITCDCHELARIRREAEAAAVELADELLELADDPAPVELCECGCGDELTQPPSGRRRRYSPGHAPSAYGANRARYVAEQRRQRAADATHAERQQRRQWEADRQRQRRHRARHAENPPPRFCGCGCGVELPATDRRRRYADATHLPRAKDRRARITPAEERRLREAIDRDLDELAPASG